MNGRTGTTRLGLSEPDTGEEPRTQVDGRASRLRSGSQSPPGGPGTTLAGPRRCPWCGHRCHGRSCEFHADLERAARAAVTITTPRERRSPAFQATCGRCGDLAPRSAWNCPTCGTPLYLRRQAVKRR